MPAMVEAGVLDNDVLALERMVAILPKLLPGLTVSWSTTSAQEAVRRCLDPQWRPMLLVTDVELDGTTGMDVCRRIRHDAERPFVLAVSSFSPRTYAAKLSQAGAQGLAVKGNMTQMAVALHRVASGGTFSPVGDVVFPTASDAHVRLSEERPRQTGVGRLSVVEQRILQLTSEGYSTEEIAEQLGIASAATIRSHTRNIREKLGARTLSHAVALWLLGDDD